MSAGSANAGTVGRVTGAPAGTSPNAAVTRRFASAAVTSPAITSVALFGS
jgi:hypothetical protein